MVNVSIAVVVSCSNSVWSIGSKSFQERYGNADVDFELSKLVRSGQGK